MQAIKEILLENELLKVTVLDYGCTFKSIIYKNGIELNELVLGYSDNNEYLENNYFLGATIGRIAGRISNSSFILDNEKISLIPNENSNFLHGGTKGLHKQTFAIKNYDSDFVEFETLISEKNDGIPGNINLNVLIKLVDNSIVINYKATTDKISIINITNHTYWNLNMNKTEKILNHNLNLSDGKFYLLDSNLIPTRLSKKISWNDSIEKIMSQNLELKNGIDHFVEVFDKKLELSSEKFNVYFQTSDPGFVIYTGNFINNLNINNLILNQQTGICIEDQSFQDSINNNLSNWVIQPGKEFKKETIWKISKK